MTKKEVIWREILFQRRENNIIKFTQKDLAQKFGFSLSTIYHALKVPRTCYAINVTGRFFTLENYKKLLILLASERKLKKEIYYESYSELKTDHLEGIMPPHITFALFSGFKFSYQTVPSDYDHLYVYAEKANLAEIISRMPQEKTKKMASNFFIIQPDPWFQNYPQPLFEQLYIDIWNAPEWYAKDFLKELESKCDL